MRGVERGAVIPVAQCWTLAQLWYEGRLDPTWRPKKPAEIEKIFRAVGLTNDFWRVT
jgi:hypothetical protein